MRAYLDLLQLILDEGIDTVYARHALLALLEEDMHQSDRLIPVPY